MHWVSSEIKQEYMAKLAEKKTELNQQSLEKAFRNILEKYGVRLVRLRVKDCVSHPHQKVHIIAIARTLWA